MIRWIFIPEVKKCQKAIEKDGRKMMLVLDNTLTHLLVIEDGHLKEFLSSNLTSLLQSINNQSVIKTMKSHNRRQLLMKLLIEGEDEEGIVSHHQ